MLVKIIRPPAKVTIEMTESEARNMRDRFIRTHGAVAANKPFSFTTPGEQAFAALLTNIDKALNPD